VADAPPILRPTISDQDAERIEREASRADRATLLRWIRELLSDRRTLSALLKGQTRRVAYARGRLHQAATYLASLLHLSEEEASVAWPGKLPCPHCGAPVAGVKAEQRAQGHSVVHDHPDGTRCEPDAHGPRTDPSHHGD
jgi:hypothetical protein